MFTNYFLIEYLISYPVCHIAAHRSAHRDDALFMFVIASVAISLS